LCGGIVMAGGGGGSMNSATNVNSEV
jgi:hypothetical protein